jgi:predicted nucleotidyltransferase
MTPTSPTLETIREQLLHRRDTLRRRFRVARLAVFGSHARGTARKRSDVDILVEFEPGGVNFDNYMELKFYLQRILRRRVDLVMIDALRPELGHPSFGRRLMSNPEKDGVQVPTCQLCGTSCPIRFQGLRSR